MKTLLSSLVAAGIGALMMLAPAQANDLEKVKQSGELRIGMSGVFRHSALSTVRTRLSASTSISALKSPSALV